MKTCEQTGITIPECCCPECIKLLIAAHNTAASLVKTGSPTMPARESETNAPKKEIRDTMSSGGLEKAVEALRRGLLAVSLIRLADRTPETLDRELEYALRRALSTGELVEKERLLSDEAVNAVASRLRWTVRTDDEAREVARHHLLAALHAATKGEGDA